LQARASEKQLTGATRPDEVKAQKKVQGNPLNDHEIYGRRRERHYLQKLRPTLLQIEDKGSNKNGATITEYSP